MVRNMKFLGKLKKLIENETTEGKWGGAHT